MDRDSPKLDDLYGVGAQRSSDEAENEGKDGAEMSNFDYIHDEVYELREKQRDNGMDDFDKGNSRNDWITYIASYAGDAGAKIFKKQLNGEAEDKRFRDNMLKVAALAIAAVEAHDKGYC